MELTKIPSLLKAAVEDAQIELHFGREDAKNAVKDLRVLAEVATSDVVSALHRLQSAYVSFKSKLLH